MPTQTVDATNNESSINAQEPLIRVPPANSVPIWHQEIALKQAPHPTTIVSPTEIPTVLSRKKKKTTVERHIRAKQDEEEGRNGIHRPIPN